MGIPNSWKPKKCRECFHPYSTHSRERDDVVNRVHKVVNPELKYASVRKKNSLIYKLSRGGKSGLNFMITAAAAAAAVATATTSTTRTTSEIKTLEITTVTSPTIVITTTATTTMTSITIANTTTTTTTTTVILETMTITA